MSNNKLLVEGWSDRFAIIDRYKPNDEQICSAFGVSTDELATARDLRSKGTFTASSTINVDTYSALFSAAGSVTKPVAKKASGSKATATTTTHTKTTPAAKAVVTTTVSKPETSTKTVREPKKRGRKGTKIQLAFAAIPSTPTPAEAFAQQNGVSLAVLRQSKRFDTSGTLGAVRVKKDRESGTLMVWRDPDSVTA